MKMCANARLSWLGRHSRSAVLVPSLVGAALAGHAWAQTRCDIKEMLELPITMHGSLPFISAQLDGHDAALAVHSGAIYSRIMPALAAKLGTKPFPGPNVYGKDKAVIGRYEAVRVAEFRLGGTTMKNVDFLISRRDTGDGMDGLLGQNFLGFMDVEYDLANSELRFMKPTNCGESSLAYWKNGVPASVLPIDVAQVEGGHYIVSRASVNGVELRVLFDSGVAHSVLSTDAARRAGVVPGGPGVIAAGILAMEGGSQDWIGPFAHFSIGDEQLNNTRLHFGYVSSGYGVDMLLGADFFLSHRIYVANSQHKIYFTYNGGRVFDLTSPTLAARSDTEADSDSLGNSAPEASAVAGASARPEGVGDPALEAERLSRAGLAFAARADLDRAIADLTQACKLAPMQAKYFYQRALIYRQAHKEDLALADFSASLALNSTDPEVLRARASVRLFLHDNPGATADYQAASVAAPSDSDLHYGIAQAYEFLGLQALAVAEYDLWIPMHKTDQKWSIALTMRCRDRALLNQALDLAAKDCDSALAYNPKYPLFLDNRGLLRLRQGDYKGSLADYNKGIDLNSKLPWAPWAFYGRGVAELRLGMLNEGQADLAAAKNLQEDIGEQAAKYGIVP
jgi:tetratricopeptide (TPR) repeat protein/predicted aspartyl protease